MTVLENGKLPADWRGGGSARLTDNDRMAQHSTITKSIDADAVEIHMKGYHLRRVGERHLTSISEKWIQSPWLDLCFSLSLSLSSFAGACLELCI